MANALPIFVSHSHVDKAFCRALVKALRKAGADVWYDEHNLGAGLLRHEIQKELGRRKIFVVILSKAAFAAPWVLRETGWAYELYDRDPERVILPVTAGPIERDDFSPETGWLFLGDFKRIEKSGYRPYPRPEAIGRTLGALALTAADASPAPTPPQPTEILEDLVTRGAALHEQGKYVEALALFERATQLAPEEAVIWYDKGAALSSLRRYSEALEAYEEALTLSPAFTAAWSNMANVFLVFNRYEEALYASEQALELDASHAGTWYVKGRSLMALKRYNKALAAFEKSLTLDPAYVKCWCDKSFTLSQLKRYSEALAAAERVITLDPGSKFGWRRKAQALRGMGSAAEAKEAMAMAMRLLMVENGVEVSEELIDRLT